MLIGGIVGLFGVAIFLGILQVSTQFSLKQDSEVASKDSEKETIPTAGVLPLTRLCFMQAKQVYFLTMKVRVHF